MVNRDVEEGGKEGKGMVKVGYLWRDRLVSRVASCPRCHE